MNKIEVVSKSIIKNDVNNASITIDNDTLTIDFNGVNDNVITLVNNIYNNVIFNFRDGSFINLFEIGSDNFQYNYKYVLNDNSKININRFCYKNNINENHDINLLGYQSDITFNLSAISNENQVYNINVNHLNKNTNSNVFNRGVTLENGRIDFIVNGIVKKGMINSSLYQDNKIMTLGVNKSLIKPNLYIDENMVNAKHGASIGRFNAEEIFYLESRGIPSDIGYKILSKGFLLSKLKLDDDLINEIENILNDL